MEWKRIEAKWHAMASRLQQMPLLAGTQTEPDAVTAPQPKLSADPVTREPDDAALRVRI